MNHQRAFKLIGIIQIFMFVIVLAFMGFVGYHILQASLNPQKYAREAGEATKEFLVPILEGIKESK